MASSTRWMMDGAVRAAARLATAFAACLVFLVPAAHGGHVITTVDSAGNVGQHTSLRMNASGNPVVGYWDVTNGDLKLATCTADCAGAAPTWQIVTVDSAGNVGAYTSLQMDASGNPVVSYNDGTNDDLKLATCTANCAGAAPTWQIVTVDSAGNVGQHPSLQMNASGNPVVSYFDFTNFDLKLAIVDLVPPAVASIVRVQPSPTNAASVDFTVTFSESVTGVDASDFALTITGVTGTTVTGVSGSGTTYTVTVATGTGSGTIRLDVVDDDTITDGLYPLGGAGAGNGSFTTGEVFTIDRTAPAVISVGVPPNANYLAGQNLDFTVNWSEPVTVTGTPQLALTIGAATVQAAFVSGSGTAALIFRYTVLAADNDNDGIAVGALLDLNGGTLRDAVGNDAALTLNGVGATAGVLVNRAFTVTPSAGANGSIAPATPQQVAEGATTAFTVTPGAGYTAVVGGTCGGSLVGTTYTTNAITANCTVAATFTQITYTVTPSAGANGSITPNTAQTIGHGATTAFTVTPAAGYTAVVGGTCGGSLVGNTYTTNAITANCTVAATFSLIPVNTFTGATATGTGNATVSFTGGGATCTFAPQGNGPAQSAFFIALTGHPKSPPAGSAPTGVLFPHGLLDFVLVNCAPGATVNFTVTYPTALSAGTQYWKYGPTPSNPVPHWYILPATIAGTTATFSITDGGLGDDDLAANGTVVDQGGPGLPPAGSAPEPVPTLSEWAMVLLALMLAGFAASRLRVARRPM